MVFTQSDFDIRCEWGPQGVTRLAPVSDVVIIVDVLSFCTSVEIAVNRGAIVYPYPYAERGKKAQEYAASVGAVLASTAPVKSGLSLSPTSLLHIERGTRLVLPSPNGATLSLRTGTTPVLAGCLRNARVVAGAASTYGKRIAVIPAGERWWDDGSLRPSFEDQVGAGAIIRHLKGSLSPEAEVALSAYVASQGRIHSLLLRCSSGRELVDRGSAQDVHLAAEIDISDCAPILREDAYQWP